MSETFEKKRYTFDLWPVNTPVRIRSGSGWMFGVVRSTKLAPKVQYFVELVAAPGASAWRDEAEVHACEKL
jgi:hypothetical protein